MSMSPHFPKVVMELASGGDLMEALELRHSGFQDPST